MGGGRTQRDPGVQHDGPEKKDHVQQRHSVGEPHSFWNVGFENNSWGGIQKMLDREYRVKVLGCFAKIKIYI